MEAFFILGKWLVQFLDFNVFLWGFEIKNAYL